MAFKLHDAQPWVDRIGTGTPLRHIELIADFDASPRSESLPRGWVISNQTSGDGQMLAASYRESIVIQIAHRNVSDPHGAKATAQMQNEIVPAVAARLAGWKPVDSCVDGPIRFVSSRLNRYDKSATVWWDIEYEIIRRGAPDLMGIEV